MPDHEPSEPTTRLNAAYSGMARLKAAFVAAGWLVDMEVVGTVRGFCVNFPQGMSVDQAEELALTIEAGVERRVITQ